MHNIFLSVFLQKKYLMMAWKSERRSIFSMNKYLVNFLSCEGWYFFYLYYNQSGMFLLKNKRVT